VIAGGFTQVAPLTAPAVGKTAVYYAPGFEDVAADVAALLEIPATQVLPATGVTGVQVYAGTDFMSGTKMGAVALPSDIVNQTAGDAVCQQANPELITR
jgi:ABC-type glucose/galactose transport system permease subunit